MDKELKTHLEGMEKRIDKRFGEVEERLSTKIIESIVESEKRLASTISDVVTLIDKRFDGVDERLDNIEEKLTPLVNQVSGHEKRITFIEEKVLQ